MFVPSANMRDDDGVPTGQEVSERPKPRSRGGNRRLALTGLDALARRIPSYTTAGRRGGAWRRQRLGQSPTRFQSMASSRAPSSGDGLGWGAVDHLSDVDLVHMPAEMSMETAVPIDFQEAWAEAQRSVNKRVVAAVEADDPVVLDRALKWKYMLPQFLLMTPGRGMWRRQQALAWRFRALAERRMTELMRSWDDARSEALYAGHARQRRTDVDLFAALLVGTADTVVALLHDKH
eukprot:jgi/Tetstr1/454533/TSEL_041430.t1